MLSLFLLNVLVIKLGGEGTIAEIHWEPKGARAAASFPLLPLNLIKHKTALALGWWLGVSGFRPSAGPFPFYFS